MRQALYEINSSGKRAAVNARGHYATARERMRQSLRARLLVLGGMRGSAIQTALHMQQEQIGRRVDSGYLKSRFRITRKSKVECGFVYPCAVAPSRPRCALRHRHHRSTSLPGVFLFRFSHDCRLAYARLTLGVGAHGAHAHIFRQQERAASEMSASSHVHAQREASNRAAMGLLFVDAWRMSNESLESSAACACAAAVS